MHVKGEHIFIGNGISFELIHIHLFLCHLYPEEMTQQWAKLQYCRNHCLKSMTQQCGRCWNIVESLLGHCLKEMTHTWAMLQYCGNQFLGHCQKEMTQKRAMLEYRSWRSRNNG